jgi:DNA-directed RNA polymerase subunit beta'
MTKERLSTPEHKILGQDLIFYSAEEVNIALNEGKLELNARVKIRAKDFNENGESVYKIIQTTAGRVLFNEVVPAAAGYINEVLTKKSLRDIIGHILSVTNVPTTAAFLDNMKDMGYKFAFKGGLSFFRRY